MWCGGVGICVQNSKSECTSFAIYLGLILHIVSLETKKEKNMCWKRDRKCLFGMWWKSPLECVEQDMNKN